MEEAQAEENTLDLGVLFFDFFLGEIGEGSLHVGLETSGRLVSQLDGSVQNTDGHSLTGLSG